MTVTASPDATSIPLCDLGAQLGPLRNDIDAAIARVIDSQAFIMGPQVATFEKEAAAYSGCAHAIGCSSGSDALLLALMALGIGPGDEVITTPFTFFATVGAITRLGATPVFADIEPAGFNIDAERLEAARTSRTKAIIPIHLFGQTAEMGPILEVADRHGLAVLEDAAQAIGAEYGGRKAGSMGAAGCYSFFPSKNLGCFGDGGMVVTNDAALAQKMRVLRVHGAKKKYIHSIVGGNFRLDTLQAAVLSVKLPHLDGWNSARQERAATYRRLIAQSGAGDRIVLPAALPNRRHVYNQFIVRTRQRDRLVEAFQARGIGSAVYYPLGMHMQECFRSLGYAQGDFPVTEDACLSTCALPMFPELTVEQQARVVATLAETLGA
jgi:dTDP-4-amino-4,6-dideoxygalactose transaminase